MRFDTALYGRTSKDDPCRVTIEIQQQTLRGWAASDPLVEKVVGQYWDDGVSGKIPLWERPEGKRLMEDVELGRVQAVTVAYVDRFGRTLLDGLQAAALLEKKGVLVIAVNDGFDARRKDDPLNFQLRLMLAEAEHRRIRERTQAGKLRAIERDKAPPGGPLVFGYRMDEHGRFVPHPDEAPIVRRIFEMALEGYSNSQILVWVNTTGVRAGHRWQKRARGSLASIASSDSSAEWHLTKIGKILRNKVYIGERRWGERVFDCEPLIDEKIFNNVQALNESRTALRGKTYRKPENGLVSGLLVCTSCGARYYHKPHRYSRKNGSVVRYPIYMCNNARKHWGICKAKTLKVDKLDADVWALIETFLEDPEALVRKVIAADQKLSGQVSNLEVEENDLSTELENIDREVNQVWEQQKANGWPLSWVTPKLNELNSRRERVLASLAEVRRQKSSVLVDLDQSMSVKAGVDSIRAKLKAGLTQAEKSHIMRLMVAGGEVQTIGTGNEKRAAVTVNIKWAYPPVPYN